MSTLTARLAQNKIDNCKMYSPAGARFQEWAINALDFKGSAAHMVIGKLVTMINNNEITVVEATAQYRALLSE